MKIRNIAKKVNRTFSNGDAIFPIISVSNLDIYLLSNIIIMTPTP